MAALPNFRIDTQSTGSGTTMYLTGELDSATSGELIDRFEALIAHQVPGEVVVDLTAVSFVDSAGLRAIIMIERSAAARSVDLAIRSPAGPVADLIQLTGIGEHVTLAPRIDDPPATAPFTERVELELPREPIAPAQARAELRATIGDRLNETDRATLTLLTSELVTNAVVHPGPDAGGSVGLEITVYTGRVRIEVTDPGPGFELGSLPPRPRDFGGHGLVVVEGLSSRWGTSRTSAEGGFRVWFELDVAPGRADETTADEAAAEETAADEPDGRSMAAEV